MHATIFKFLGLCKLAVLVFANAPPYEERNDWTCPRPQPPSMSARKFYSRLALIQNAEDLPLLCGDVAIPNGMAEEQKAAFLEKVRYVCQHPDDKLVRFFININSLPAIACDPYYKNYRFTLNSELLKPDGSVANRIRHKSCYKSILQHQAYKDAFAGVDSAEVANQLNLKELELQKQGEHKISCELAHFKHSLSQFFKSDKTIQGTGIAVTAAALPAGVLTALAMTGVGAAAEVGTAVAVLAVLIGRLLFFGGHDLRGRRHELRDNILYLDELRAKVKSTDAPKEEPSDYSTELKGDPRKDFARSRSDTATLSEFGGD